jgi:hypothetical protein
MRGEGVLASIWWFWKVCVDREFGMPEEPESGMKGDVYTYIYIYIACIGKPQLYLLNLLIPVV